MNEYDIIRYIACESNKFIKWLDEKEQILKEKV